MAKSSRVALMSSKNSVASLTSITHNNPNPNSGFPCFSTSQLVMPIVTLDML